MKMFKKISSLLLAVMLLLSMTACHGKDEVALTVNGVEIKSGLYVYALIEADQEAKVKVDETLEASEEAAASAAKKSDGTTDYMKQSVEGLSFEAYVKDKAIEKCKEFAFYQTLIDNKTVTLTDEEKSSADYMAEYYWSAGYADVYLNNGVSFETFKKATLYDTYATKYFMHLYDEKGEKAVSKADRLKYLTDNFQLVYLMSTSYKEGASADEKAKVKAKYEAYADRLEKGESFEKIYNEEYPPEEEETTTSSTVSSTSSKTENSSATETSSATTSSTTSSATESSSSETTSSATETKEEKPKDEQATPIVDPDADISAYYQNSQYYAGAIVDDNFADLYDLKKGTVKVVEDKEKTAVSLYVKLDITEDEYYLNYHNTNILHTLKQDEFDKDTKAIYGAYTFEENTYATNRFDVEDLVYPESTATA